MRGDKYGLLSLKRRKVISMREFWPRNKLQICKKGGNFVDRVRTKKYANFICFPNKQQYFNVTDGKHKDIIKFATLDMIFLIFSDYIKKTVQRQIKGGRSREPTNSQYISKS